MNNNYYDNRKEYPAESGVPYDTNTEYNEYDEYSYMPPPRPARSSGRTGIIVTLAIVITLLIITGVIMALVMGGVISFGDVKTSEGNVSSSQASTSQEVIIYVCDKDGAVFRTEPKGGASNVIKTLGFGEGAVFLENSTDGYFKVRHDGQEGYILKSSLSNSVPEYDTKQPETEPREPYEPYEPPVNENTMVVSYKYVTNVPNSIYLRSTPEEVDSNIIGTIPLGCQVGYIESANSIFAKIEFNGTIGYAKHMYLSNISPQEEIYDYMFVSNVPHSIYLRSTPSDVDTSNVICEIPVGDMVGFLGVADDVFYKIRWNGRDGYAKAIYLE